MLASRAVGAELEAEEAAAVDRLHHDRARAVAEKHERRAVVPVEDLREHVAADHERASREAAASMPYACATRVHEPGAAREQVVGGRVVRPERVGEQRGVVGNIMSGVTVAQMSRSMSAAVDAGFGERLPRGGQRDVRERLVVACDAALADARALADPLVRGVDDRRRARRS